METSEDLEPVFQYRNWSNDNHPIQLHDDDDSLELDHLAQSQIFDFTTSGLQEWNALSTSDGWQQSAELNEHSISQWQAPASTSHQLQNLAVIKLIDTEPVPLPLGLALLRYLQVPDDPWSCLRLYHLGTSTLATHNIPAHIGDEISASTIYLTATSEITASQSFRSAKSYIGSCRSAMVEAEPSGSKYFEILRSRGLWPVNTFNEQNWSGRGQHVEFKQEEYGRINDLLAVEEPLGHGIAGVVHRVKCRRITMARKTLSIMKTKKRNLLAEAVNEVVHMNRLRHAHIIRLIGTYACKAELCILMYPVANGTLETFLEYMCNTAPEAQSLNPNSLDDSSSHGSSSHEHPFDITQTAAMALSCQGFFSCLSSAIRYIHCTFTKHMDIKPSNILVRSRWFNRGGRRLEYSSKVYISDFGTSRSYKSIDAANTDGPTSFTRKYASPEVSRKFDRGLPTDIFSFGCVFLEMFAALDHFYANASVNSRPRTSLKLHETSDSRQASYTLQERLKDLLDSNHNSDRSYQANLDPLQELIKAQIPECGSNSILSPSTLRMISMMIQGDPQKRPTADHLVEEFGEKACCMSGPDKLKATDENLGVNPEANLEEFELQHFWGRTMAADLEDDCLPWSNSEGENTAFLLSHMRAFH